MSLKVQNASDEAPNEFSLELYAIMAWVTEYTEACEAFARDLKALVRERRVDLTTDGQQRNFHA